MFAVLVGVVMSLCCSNLISLTSGDFERLLMLDGHLVVLPTSFAHLCLLPTFLLAFSCEFRLAVHFRPLRFIGHLCLKYILYIFFYFWYLLPYVFFFYSKL